MLLVLVGVSYILEELVEEEEDCRIWKVLKPRMNVPGRKKMDELNGMDWNCFCFYC